MPGIGILSRSGSHYQLATGSRDCRKRYDCVPQHCCRIACTLGGGCLVTAAPLAEPIPVCVLLPLMFTTTGTAALLSACQEALTVPQPSMCGDPPRSVGSYRRGRRHLLRRDSLPRHGGMEAPCFTKASCISRHRILTSWRSCASVETSTSGSSSMNRMYAGVALAISN